MRIGQAWIDTDPRGLLLRLYDGTERDLEALTVVRNATLRATTPAEDFQEWEASRMDRFYNRGDFSLRENAWLIFSGDMPVGAAVIYPRAFFLDRPPGNFDLYVVPQFARHGLGSRLLAHLEQAAIGRGHQTLETTVAREDDRSTSFLEGRGFRVVGQSAHLARHGLDSVSAVRFPAGYALGTLAEMGGEPQLYAETTNRLGSYDSNYSLVTETHLAAVVEGEGWEPNAIFFLLDDERRIVGLIRASAETRGRGYLHEIRLEPASRGKGLGTALVMHALRHLRDRGVQRVDLDTTGEGTPAHTLAVRCGFAVMTHWLHYLKRLSA